MSDAPSPDDTPVPGPDRALIDRARRQVEQVQAAPGPAGSLNLSLPTDFSWPGSPSGVPGQELKSDSFTGYEIVREIHRGGQGVVYEAIQLSTKRTVAVKVLLHGPFADDRAKWRFEQEIKLVASLKHPHIVTVHDSGIVYGKYFFAMDFVRGHPLDTHVRTGIPEVRPLIELFRTVCLAVAHAHRHGIIHRDLKPSNILVTQEGVPCVLDFGLAKIMTGEPAGSENVSITGRLMGTLRYMAPEQTLGDPRQIDTRTDVYSLGVILYELITRAAPYDTRVELAAAIRNVREIEPPRPGRIRKDIDTDLETIVLKAMAKEPERRYQSAGELAEDLGAWLDGRPIMARSASSLYVVRKLAVRHSFETLVLLALVLGVGGSGGIGLRAYWLAWEAQRRQRQSEQAYIEKNQGLIEFGRQASDWLNLQSVMGWFLLEWHQNHLDRARALRDAARDGSPERALMSFLLDGNRPVEGLLTDLPPELTTLAFFAAGERRLRSGDGPGAIEMFRSSVASAGPRYEWVAQAAQARLAGPGGAATRPGLAATAPNP